MGRKWLVIYSRPRWEKKVNQLLVEKGIECYCPLNRITRQWSDRIKIVEEPLFKSYIFVKVDDNDRGNVRMTSGVINFVYWNGKPAVVKEKEINAIKRFLGEHTNVQAHPIDISVNQEVRIIAGPLMDKRGKVVAIQGKRAKVVIESLGYMLVASLDKQKLEITDSLVK